MPARSCIAGKPTRFASAADANSKGIGMVFQEQSLLTNLTVGENIYLGNEAQFTRFGIVDWRALYAAAARQLAKVQVDVDPRMRADDLDFAARQMVELAKALTLEEQAGGHLVILLDEPTSVLERAEIEILFARVRALKSRASFIFVSHRLDEVLELSDRIYVMKDGAVVADLAAARRRRHRAASADGRPQPAGRILPRAAAEAVPRRGRARGRRAVAWPAPTSDVSFKLHAGEILGIAGVIGSGREELTRTLAGFAPHDGGRLLDRRPRGAAAHRRPRRSTSASATSRASGASRAWCCSCRSPPTSRWPTSASLRRYGLIDAARGAPAGDELGRAAEDPHARHRHALPQPLRRQPAEGGAGQMAERQGRGS